MESNCEPIEPYWPLFIRFSCVHLSSGLLYLSSNNIQPSGACWPFSFLLTTLHLSRQEGPFNLSSKSFSLRDGHRSVFLLLFLVSLFMKYVRRLEKKFFGDASPKRGEKVTDVTHWTLASITRQLDSFGNEHFSSYLRDGIQYPFLSPHPPTVF